MRGWLLAAVATSAMLSSESSPAQRYARGLEREPEAVYRSFPGTPTFRAYLPPEVDISHRFPRPGDQGQQSSCTAWAVGYAMRSFYESRRSDWDISRAVNQFSPAFIYNQLNRGNRDCHGGTAISTALELIKNQGIATLAEFPYSANDCSRMPSREILDRASGFKINGWRTVSPSRLDDIKGQLHAGNPVIFGMELSASFDELRGNRVYDDTSSPRTGSHAMVLVGYSEQQQAFKLINSWGVDWGDRGFGWVSYRALAQLSDRLFVVDVPAPPPKVVPVPPLAIVEPPPKPAPAPPVPVVVSPPKPSPVPPIAVIEPPPKPAPAPPAPVVVSPPNPAPPVAVVEPPPKPTPVLPVVIVDPPPKPKPPPVAVVEPKPAPTPPAPVVAPAPLTLAQIREELARRTAALPCSRLESRVSDDGVIRINGMTGSPEALNALRAEFRNSPGVRDFSINAASRPWPQCEALLTFDQTLATPRGMQVQIRAAQPQLLRDGDALVLDITTPAHPSYLYVSYVQASGDVVHLIKPEGNVPRAFAPGTRVALGADPRGPSYKISAPFGEEMIVVIASASPLFSAGELPLQQTEREYLTTFRKAFMYQPPGFSGERTVSGASVTLRTQGR